MQQPIRALLVEDDPEYASLVRLMLEEASKDARFEVVCVDRLATAMKRMAEKGLDVALIDLMLPDSEGLATLSAARAAVPRLPIIALTGLDDSGLALKAAREGVQDYLVKGSFGPEILYRAVRYAMERTRLQAGLQGIIDSSADAMVVVVQGRLRYANPSAEALFGKPSARLLGEPFPLPEPPRTRAEMSLPGPEGEEREVEMRVSDLFWEDAPARLASLRDVTRLKRFERLRAELAQRRKIQELQEQFVYSVSHELRSPLTVVKGVLCNLRDGLDGPLNAPQADAVQMADRNLERGLRMLGGLLDLARLESGQARVERVALDLLRLVRQAAEDFSALQRRGKLKLEVELPAGLPPVEGDADMLAQVVVNLLDNAARFARTSIRLRVCAAAPVSALGREGAAGGEARVRIEDDGPGIAEEQIEGLFDKYVQVSRRPRKSAYRGTGLGLAICKEILELHGGRIWAEPAPGVGGRFEFSLPFAGARAGTDRR